MYCMLFYPLLGDCFGDSEVISGLLGPKCDRRGGSPQYAKNQSDVQYWCYGPPVLFTCDPCIKQLARGSTSCRMPHTMPGGNISSITKPPIKSPSVKYMPRMTFFAALLCR